MANTPAVRVRIAPSPTGKLHIGTARTALFNFLFAKKAGGRFIVRLEDTDQARSEDQFTTDILDGLKWLGLQWDEGLDVGGEFGPYAQSQRLDSYQKFTDQLLASGRAYKCFCTPAELEAERQAAQAKKEAPKYSGKCRNLAKAEVAANEAAGQPFAVRLKVDAQTLKFDDLIRGQMSFDAGLFGDFPIVRSGGGPLFLFTNTIDDELMKISHVLRGEDHLSNTAKQLLLCQALHFDAPQFGHLPLILNADRSKMSKRKNPVSITDDYRAKGYLPEAIVNYLALLGWAPGDDQEIYQLNALIKAFSIERVGKSPAIFDGEKLLWLNGYYIRQLPLGELASRAIEFIKEGKIKTAARANPDFYLQAVALVQERLKILSEIEGLIGFCYQLPSYDRQLLIAKKSNAGRAFQALKAAAETLKKLTPFTLDSLETALRAAASDQRLTDGELLWTIRVALTGSATSPGVFEVLELLGQKESLKRLASAQKKFSSS